MVPKMKVVELFLPCWLQCALKNKSVYNNPKSVESKLSPVDEIAGPFAKLKIEAKKLLLGGPC